MFYFYTLQSTHDSKYYFGSTKDLKRRVLEHQAGKVTSTKNRLPLELVYYEAYRQLSQARYREKQVKNSGSIRRALLARLEQ
jgi:putative endonuclease